MITLHEWRVLAASCGWRIGASAQQLTSAEDDKMTMPWPTEDEQGRTLDNDTSPGDQIWVSVALAVAAVLVGGYFIVQALGDAAADPWQPVVYAAITLLFVVNSILGVRIGIRTRRYLRARGLDDRGRPLSR